MNGDDDDDLYECLGLDSSASHDEIRHTYKKLAVDLHPDKTMGDADKTERFKKASAAYSILSNPDTRRAYDQSNLQFAGGPTHCQNSGSGMEDILNDMMHAFARSFGNVGPFHFHSSDDDGAIPEKTTKTKEKPLVSVTVELGLRDIVVGDPDKKIKIVEPPRTCNGCHGLGVDPSSVRKCDACGGTGSTTQILGGFAMISTTCGKCMGRGMQMLDGSVEDTVFKCNVCSGKGSQVVEHTLSVCVKPRSVRNGSIEVFTHLPTIDVAVTYVHAKSASVFEKVMDTEGDVATRVKVSLKELLCGFVYPVDFFGEIMNVTSNGYFDPGVPVVVPDKGLLGSGTNLTIHFDVTYAPVEQYPRLATNVPLLTKLFEEKNIV